MYQGGSTTIHKRGRSQPQSHLKAIFQDARMVRLFRAGHVRHACHCPGWALDGARDLRRRSTHNPQRARPRKANWLERDPKGVSLMTMHKSKGKEFDGVVMVESIHSSHFLLGHEAPGFAPSRRLLRVGITRARSFVLLVRPRKEKPLVEG
ncbi:ATP-binding domain-containing protein [Antarcticimicrobium luteum]|uniref:ATP-dependent helicase n=1 Tax=Antarcticimicrobium luteum TaxID=2547397 RepID=A0A4V3AR82_9RHOB|nr:ATP-dependent helicase [Antarcticimicrobium luteum]